MDGFTVRPARLDDSDDIEDVVAFWSRAGQNAGRPPDHADAVRRLVERDPGALLVVEHDGRIVASVVAGWDGWRANLYRLAVDPGLRGRGLARLVLDAAEERLRELGATRLCAMVLDANEVGASFWAAAGYVRQDDWRRWVKPVQLPRPGTMSSRA